MKRSSSSFVIRELQNKTTVRCRTLIRMAKIHNKTDNIKGYWGCWATGTHSLLWESKMVQLLWSQFCSLTKLNIVLPYNPEVTLLVICPIYLKTIIYTKTSMQVFITVLLNCPKLEAVRMSFNRWMETITCAASIWWNIICQLRDMIWQTTERHRGTMSILISENQFEKTTYYVIPIIWHSRKHKNIQ